MSRSVEIRAGMDALIAEGNNLVQLVRTVKEPTEMISAYQVWYSAAMKMIRVVLPSRAAEFNALYAGSDRGMTRKFGISEFLEGDGADYFLESDRVSPVHGMLTQVALVEAAAASLDGVLFNLEGVVQADLFTNELEAATDLLKNGHRRAAGVVAGVVIERHLKQVATYHSFKSQSQRKPTMADFNEFLKKTEVIDTATWRFIQRMGDLRNKCAHPDDEPTKQEIEDLISGAKKIQAEVS